jgi:4-diphosphocytidyl-2-C-methyl-D-erythritol kinase
MEAATMMMRSTANGVAILAPAKINLFLEIFGKRDDGFHELETVMSTVSLHDELHFGLRPDDAIHLQVYPRNFAEAIPGDDRNLVVQAVQRLRQRFEFRSSCDRGFDIFLRKRIPSEAGLGGASSDAASALVAANKLWDLNCPPEQLAEIAAEIGSDVPFFLHGGTAICRGRGEQIEPVTGRIGLPLVIGKPPAGLSTARVYRRLQPPFSSRSGWTLVKQLRSGAVGNFSKCLFNRLQFAAESLSHEIERFALAFQRINCPGHLMSGSGTAYYGVFSTCRAARRAVQTLSNRVPRGRFFYCHTLGPSLDFVT